MRIARGQLTTGEIAWLAVEGPMESPTYIQLEPQLDTPFRDWKRLDSVTIERFLPPVNITSILCIGLNYKDHVNDLGQPLPKYPVVIPKWINTPIGHQELIQLPRDKITEKVDFEGELVVVIGVPARDVTPERALDYVMGFTCGNDVSARDWQFELGGSQWSRGKSFDTFAPIGPWLITADEWAAPPNRRIETRLNGTLQQSATIGEMIFSVAEIISFLSQSTLLPVGTVIMTGTPAGVGFKQKPPRWLQPGDTISVTIDGIGTLTNSVTLES